MAAKRSRPALPPLLPEQKKQSNSALTLTGQARLALYFACLPDHDGQHDHHQGQHADVDAAPAHGVQQLARAERGYGHRAEHQKVIQRLHLGALGRACSNRSAWPWPQ